MSASTFPLLRTWAVLTALTLATMLLGGGGHEAAPGLAAAAGVVAITVVKGRQILTHYLGLHGAGRGWRTVLTGYLLVVGATILGAYAIALFR